MLRVTAVSYARGWELNENGAANFSGAIIDTFDMGPGDAQGSVLLIALLQTDDPDESNDVSIDLSIWREGAARDRPIEHHEPQDPFVTGRNRWAAIPVPGRYFVTPGEYKIGAAIGGEQTAYLRVAVVPLGRM